MFSNKIVHLEQSGSKHAAVEDDGEGSLAVPAAVKASKRRREEAESNSVYKR